VDSIECILKVVVSVSYILPLSSYRLCIEGCSEDTEDSIECILKVVVSISYSLPLSSYRLCILRIV
jgi:hypothetical protein